MKLLEILSQIDSLKTSIEESETATLDKRAAYELGIDLLKLIIYERGEVKGDTIDKDPDEVALKVSDRLETVYLSDEVLNATRRLLKSYYSTKPLFLKYYLQVLEELRQIRIRQGF